MTITFRATILAAAIAAMPLAANAAGLGKLTVFSALGQPLRAEVDLSATREELSSLSAQLASQEAFKQAGIDFTPSLASVKFAVDRKPNGTAVLKISSSQPINDPFLDLLIELNWANGRLSREYTFLLDPADVGRQAAPAAAPADVPESAAAPAAAARQARVNEAAPTASPEGGEYKVKSGDTLSKIAAANKPEGVSVDQMLVAIYNNNKSAFDGNMNRLKAGRILTIPDREAASAVAPGEARSVITAETADFNAYRAKLAEAARSIPAVPDEAPQQASSGKITPKVADAVPAPAPGQDQLKVSKTGQPEVKGEAKTDAKTAQKLTQLEEDIAAKDRAVKEANSRVADLEKNVRDLQKLLELKNQNLAELQKQAAAKPAAAPEKPVVAPPAPPVETPSAPAAEAPKPAEAAPLPEPPKAEEVPKPAPVAEAPKPEPKPEVPADAKPAATPPGAAEEPSVISELLDNPLTLAAGGGVLALLIGLGVMRARRRTGENDLSMPAPSIAPPSQSGTSVFGTTGGQNVDTASSQIQTDFSQSAMTAIDADEGVDPVAEADVYMAYGRDAQAEEILLDALKNEPTRHAIQVKLLEIYAQRKNVKQFENLATQLYSLTNGTGSDWEKAAAMGAKLDPENPLYGGAGKTLAAARETDPTVVPAATAAASAPASVLMSSEQNVKDTWTMPGELSQIARAVEGGADELPADSVPAIEETPAVMSLDKLDFDLDLGDDSKADEPTVASVDKLADLSTVDFDQTSYKSSGAQERTEPTGRIAAAASEPEMIDLTATQPNDVRALDFDLDSVLSDTKGPAHEETAQDEPVVDLEKTDVGGSLADFDFELGESRPVEAPATSPRAVDLAGISLELPAETSDVATLDDDAFLGAEETNTKLELARAYEEMGDREGARELLGEVLKEGTGEQQDRAKELLAKLA